MTERAASGIRIRAATADDSAELARLMNIAGEGIPAFLWSLMAEPGEDALAVGARRVARTEGGFSYTHARVAIIEERVAGMLLGYRLPDPHGPGPLEEYPEVVRPLVVLESLAPGSWYVNAVAVTEAARGGGIGRQLMLLAEALALESGASAVSLIVAEANAGARRLYETLGFETVARRTIVPFPGCPHEGDWLLMIKGL
jgi:ribosomal protein S18 acetylase RimI-like enzyme